MKRTMPNTLSKTIIIGNGEEHEKLLEYIRIQNLEDSVFCIGFVPDAQTLLAGIDIFVLPSTKEGLPYVILEALNAERPVIATKVGGIPDIIKNGENGLLVPAKSPTALASALKELLSDRKKCERFAHAGHATVIQKFGLTEMLAHTITLYESRTR